MSHIAVVEDNEIVVIMDEGLQKGGYTLGMVYGKHDMALQQCEWALAEVIGGGPRKHSHYCPKYGIHTCTYNPHDKKPNLFPHAIQS